MRFAYRIIKARIGTHILIAYLLQKWLRECASVLRYTYNACLVLTEIRILLLKVLCILRLRNMPLRVV
jgi:hypothetical protein